VSTICVIGTGYVGLVTGTCFSDMGNQVTCVDIIPEKIERLKQGILPIYEPGLEEMVARNVHAGRLHFTTSYSEGLDNCDFIFIAVNTPTGSSQGGADMRYVESAARGIAHHTQKSEATRGSLCCHLQPGILARRLCCTGFPESRPRCFGFIRPGSSSKSRHTLPPLARTHRDHRSLHRRDDQVRFQRVPGNQDIFYQ